MPSSSQPHPTTTPLTGFSSPFTSTSMPIFTQSIRLSTIPPPPYYLSLDSYIPQQPLSQPTHIHNTTFQPASFPSFPSFPYPSTPHHSQSTHPTPICNPKLELSTFDGTNPLEWLFQAGQFFTFYQIPLEHRMFMSSFYMKGEALSWLKWMYQNQQLFDWVSFIKSLKIRFGPSTYANHQVELFKLRQQGSVSE